MKRVFSNLKNWASSRSNKDKSMILKSIIFDFIIIILLKIPFDLIRDLGYDHIKVLNTNDTYYILWKVIFLTLYIITIICLVIHYVRKIRKQYK